MIEIYKGKLALLTGLFILSMLLGACDPGFDVEEEGATVTVSGTMNWITWTTGDYLVAAFPGGTDPGSTGSIGGEFVTGTATSETYSFTVDADSGSAYIFAWNDADGSQDPTTGEAGDCSALFTIGSSDITVADMTFVIDGWCNASP